MISGPATYEMLHDKQFAWLALQSYFRSFKQKKIPISVFSNKK